MSIIEDVLIENGWSDEGAAFLLEHALDRGMPGELDGKSGLVQKLVRRLLGMPPLRDGRSATDKRLRKLVVERDGAFCATCGSETSLTIDHIVPVIRGGTDALENLRVLCQSCNSRKGAR